MNIQYTRTSIRKLTEKQEENMTTGRNARKIEKCLHIVYITFPKSHQDKSINNF